MMHKGTDHQDRHVPWHPSQAKGQATQKHKTLSLASILGKLPRIRCYANILHKLPCLSMLASQAPHVIRAWLAEATPKKRENSCHVCHSKKFYTKRPHSTWSRMRISALHGKGKKEEISVCTQQQCLQSLFLFPSLWHSLCRTEPSTAVI